MRFNTEVSVENVSKNGVVQKKKSDIFHITRPRGLASEINLMFVALAHIVAVGQKIVTNLMGHSV